jgi:hypothetical protein
MTDRVLNEGGHSKISVQGIREAKTAATTIVGSVKPLAYGKEVVYAFVTAAISAGSLVQGTAAVANHNARPAMTASVGATEVTIVMGATSAAEDIYKDGILLVTCGTGTGYSYMIDSHPAFAASSSAKITLKDGLETTLDTTSITILLKNKYNGCTIAASAAMTGQWAGVTLCSAAASSYVYLGKKGEWPAKVEGTWIVGQMLTYGSADGSVAPYGTATTTNIIVGVARSTPSTSGWGICDFDL